MEILCLNIYFTLGKDVHILSRLNHPYDSKNIEYKNVCIPSYHTKELV